MSKKGKPKICICLSGKTIEENLRILERYRAVVDYVELRADCLEPSERFNIRSFPEKAQLPCILTIRRKQDGGNFEDGEGVRLVLFAKALSFPKPDAKANYAFVDLEDDFRTPVIEEACHTFGTRIVRSHYFHDGIPENFDTAYEQIAQEDDEIPKLVVNPQSSADFIRFLEWAIRVPKREHLLIATGAYGIVSHVLAWRFGSMWTYASPLHSGMEIAAPSHFDPFDLRNIYNFDLVNEQTELYSLIGQHSILASLSPYLHNKAFRERINRGRNKQCILSHFAEGCIVKVGRVRSENRMLAD